jgi:hypothetical protein
MITIKDVINDMRRATAEQIAYDTAVNNASIGRPRCDDGSVDAAMVKAEDTLSKYIQQIVDARVKEMVRRESRTEPDSIFCP